MSATFIAHLLNVRNAIDVARRAGDPMPDDAMDSLTDAISIIDKEIYSTPSATYADLTAKITLGLQFAEESERDGCYILLGPDLLEIVAAEWRALEDLWLDAQIRAT